jgi:acetyl esterase/lipase
MSVVRALAVVAVVSALAAGCSADDGGGGGAAGDPSTTTEAEPLVAPEGDAFYQPPDPLPEGEPGDLIWAQEIEAPEGSAGWRILYHSESLAGDDIAVSGSVYAPAGGPGDGDRPVFGLAHGTVGLGDTCAPSRAEPAQAPLFLDPLIERGFVVAATDYEGLGTPGVHPYVVGLSEARSVLDSVRAAQQIPETGAGSRFIVGGHSQGGGAALVTGEVAADYAPDLELVAVVAGAPAAELRLIGTALQSSPYFGYLAMAAAGFHAAYPDLPLEAVMTPAAIAELPQVEELCVGDIIGRYQGRDPATVVAGDPGQVEPWASRLEENSPGVRPAAAPVLMYHGTADEQIPAVASELVLDRYCDLGGAPVERRTYEGQTHRSVIEVAMPDILAFIDARLAGEPAATSC